MKSIKQPHNFSVGDRIHTCKRPPEHGTIQEIYEDDRIRCSFIASDGRHISTFERIVFPNEIVLDPSYPHNTQLPKWDYCRVKGVGKSIMKVERIRLQGTQRVVDLVWEDKHGSLRRETLDVEALECVDHLDTRGWGKTRLEEKIKVDAITSSLSPLDVITPDDLQKIIHYLLCAIDATSKEPASVANKFEFTLAQLRPEIFRKLWPNKPLPSKKS